MDKNAKKYGKVSRPGLYKRILLVQERPSIQQVCYSTSCFLFIVTCYTWQVWSNAAKRVQMRWTFADAPASRKEKSPKRRSILSFGLTSMFCVFLFV